MTKTCPRCGAEMTAESIGWSCPICKAFMDMEGGIHLHKEEPFVPPAPKHPYFVSYIGQVGYSGHAYGNGVCTSDEKIENVQHIRQMEAEIRKAEGYDRVVILSVMPLTET